MKAQKQFYQNLRTISVQPPDTTLITSEGEHIATQQHLLSAASPFLASLLAQAGPFGAAISLPFGSQEVRYIIHKLGSVDEGADEIEGFAFSVAKVLGIEYLKEKKSRLSYISKAEDFVFEEHPEILQPAILSKVDKNEQDNEREMKKSVILDYDKETKLKYDCNSCEISFKSQSELKTHRRAHTEMKCIVCDKCGKSFATERTKNLHFETTHSGTNPYACQQCGKSISSPGNLVVHMRKKHTESHIMPCPKCGKQVKDIGAHINHVHVISDENFPCQECGKLFRTKKDVTNHMKCHAPDEIKIANKEKAMAKYKCTFCGKGFIDSTRLKWHEASRHTGQKNFQCQQCNKSFFRPDHLRTHISSVH